MRLTFPTIAVAALALCGGDAVARGQTSPATDLQAAARDAATYVAKAGASDLYEIQSSQLAQSAGASAKVRDFARMMIDDHTATTRQVTEAARSAGLSLPPPALEPDQQTMLDQLRGLTGSAFDTAYLQQQRTAHDKALALHSGYAKNGDTPALRAVAKSAVPIIRHHIDRLQSLSAG
jgi:putative membrane protein